MIVLSCFFSQVLYYLNVHIRSFRISVMSENDLIQRQLDAQLQGESSQQSVVRTNTSRPRYTCYT